MEPPPRMLFGAFKGWLMTELPDDYLAWLDTLGTLRPPLRGYVADELAARAERRAELRMEDGRD